MAFFDCVDKAQMNCGSSEKCKRITSDTQRSDEPI